MTGDAGQLWAITCYFNPAGYRRRRENYRIFRERLGVPLVTVELGFDGLELQPGDADSLIQLCEGDIMFQKERLLNLALGALPRDCASVAWLDCDVLFERPDWPLLALEGLQRHALVHLFQARLDLPRDYDGAGFPPADVPPTAMSSIYKIRELNALPEDMFVPNSVLRSGCGNGLAWAARRDLLDRHGLYDASILGSGDQAVVCASYGLFDHYTGLRSFTEAQARHYRAWARPFFDSVRGRVGWAAGRVFHLWHGERANRKYERRYQDIAGYRFDPYVDIALSPEGCWRWNSEKPELHEHVKRYFRSRNEDG